ncbi:MAG: protein kinase [Polyangiaceae bacterium]
MTLQTGQIVDDKYRIVRVLGKGGMGAVYEGENTRIHRRVAIKVLLAEVANKADIVQRFEREAQAAGRIGSEHIVEVLDLGSLPSGERYMVMEFLDGEALGDRIKRVGKMPAADCARILEQLLEGLGAAHDAGIIHRDLKPDNVFLVRSKSAGPDFVKIVDFGVSKFSSTDETFSMTRTGAVMGTPYYMSPEQARGQKIDHRSDLYAVGVVGYQMLTGRVPFNADTFNELLFKIALESPEPAELHAPGLDPAFSQIIARGMARDAAHRFGSAKEFAHAIAMWRQHAQPGGYPMQGYPQAPASQRSYPYPQAAPSGPGYPSPSHPGQSHGFANTPVPGGVPPYGSAPTNPSLLNPAMNQSQVGVAVATAPPAAKKSSGWVAIVAVMAVLGVGGGIAAYKFVGASPSPAASTTPGTAIALATEAPTAEKTESPSLPATSAPPAASSSAPLTVESAPTADPKASTQPTASAPPTVIANNGPGTRPPVVAPTPSTVKKPPPGGGPRTIDGSL